MAFRDEDWILSEPPVEQCEKLSRSTKQCHGLSIRACLLARSRFSFHPLPRNWARTLWRHVLFILCVKACLSPSGLPRLWSLPSWYLVGTLASWIKSFQGGEKPFYFSSPRLFQSQDRYLSLRNLSVIVTNAGAPATQAGHIALRRRKQCTSHNARYLRMPPSDS